MCMGLPMRVEIVEPGWAWVQGRGQRLRVRTALVGEPQAGEWLLVHLDSAIERLDDARAAEVDAALDLVAAAMQGRADEAARTDLEFSLPSALSAEQLAALTGARPKSA